MFQFHIYMNINIVSVFLFTSQMLLRRDFMFYSSDLFVTGSSRNNEHTYPAWLIDERYNQCDNFTKDFKDILTSSFFHFGNLFKKGLAK